MNQQVHTIAPYVLLFLSKRDKILLIRRFQTGFGDGNYSLVGGKVEAHETLVEAVQREAQEEIGITISLEHINLLHVIHAKRPDNTLIIFCFTALQWIGDPYNKEVDKHDDVQWFDWFNLPQNILATHAHILDMIRQGNVFSEDGFNNQRLHP